MSDHTPGPWIRNGQGEIAGVPYWRIDSLGEERVGMDFLMHPVALVRTDADATLIESAPDMNAELVALRQQVADLRAALENTTAWLEDLLYEPPCSIDEANRDDVADAIIKANGALGRATQPQEVQEREGVERGNQR